MRRGSQFTVSDVANARVSRRRGLWPRSGGGATGPTFSPLDLGAKLLFWFDASDKSVLWQDAGGTTPVTASGQTVARIRDKSANNYFMDRRAAGTGVYTESGGNRFIAQNGDGSGYSLNSTISGLTSTCEFFNVIRTSDSGDVVAGANSASGSITFGRIAGFTATAVGMTTPTYYKNGADIGVITSGNTLRSQLVTGSWVQFGAVPVDMTGAAWTSFWPMTNPAFGPGSMNGDWMHIVLTTQLTELERLQLQTWLQDQVNPL